MGEVIISDKNVIINVLTIAGKRDTFSVLYVSANNDGFKWGTPFTKTYKTIENNIPNVRKVAKEIRNLINLFTILTSFLILKIIHL